MNCLHLQLQMRAMTKKKKTANESTYVLPGTVRATCAIALSLPATSSTALVPWGTEKWAESMYLTALRNSTIQTGKGEWLSSMLGGISTPHDVFGNTYGPSSNSPFFNIFSATF
ncbi:hypothetical protein AAHE18_06G220200 [Arachis hypogaea]